jgi:N-acyl-D-aspartate/D-glutamate deacylase
MQDPMIAGTIGQNPMAQQIMASLQAHIAEHLGFSYRKQIEERLGVPLPPPDEQLPEDMEVQLARLVADAGKQLTQSHQQNAAQQQAQQQAQDPLFQLEQAKVKIQEMEVSRKAAKDQTDAQLAGQKLQLDKDRVEIEAMKEGMRVEAQQDQAKERLRLDALKVLATPQQQPKMPGSGE